MRYFLENFEKVYNKDWPFGYFPAYNFYASTGTHIGTDFKVPVGTPVYAPVDGEMFKTEFNRYKGNVGIFIFKHKDIEWGLELCHLREQPEKRLYKEGEIISYSGMTGEKVAGAHLHAVLHRDAAVSKHYQQLTSREEFLRLEKAGAIVDCFQWFCASLQDATEVPAVAEVVAPAIETVPEVKPAPIPKSKASVQVAPPNDLIKIILDFLRSLFVKH